MTMTPKQTRTKKKKLLTQSQRAMRYRLDEMTGRIAAGWYSVTAQLDGEVFGENPRAIDGGIPGSVTASIVQHAAALLREVDAYVEDPKAWREAQSESMVTPFLIASAGDKAAE